jgi:hypothetical protein
MKSRVECGCAIQTCTGIAGCPGCEWCKGEGYRLVECADCCDSGRLFGGDAECKCEAARVEHAQTPTSPDAIRLAAMWKLEAASLP